MGISRAIWHPTRVVPLAFLAAIVAGTVLLTLPIARAGPGGAPLMVALFTATSAVCVTGLAVVDTGTYWSGFGQAIILLLFQLGGLGIMTAATLLGLLVSNRLRLGQRLLTQAETHTTALGDIAATMRLVLLVTVTVQSVITAFLFTRFLVGYRASPGAAAWEALFHTAAAFNNAGFSLDAESLGRYELDAFVLLPLMAAVLIGGIGFPVLYELKKGALQPARWSLHTKLTLAGTAFLIVVGTTAVALFEWFNPLTLGALPWYDRLMGALFHAGAARTSGFHALEVGAMHDETLLVSVALMLIGGGSASTAGGIKVTTFVILGLIVLAEVQGERDATSYRRRIAEDTQRVALSVALLSIMMVSAGTLILLGMTDFTLLPVLFEVTSAFATNGMSTGITPDLPERGQLLLVLLMFAGRVGTVTIAAALALRSRPRPYRYPEERPIIG